MKRLRIWCALLAALCCCAGARRAAAHPMGNFSINHSARFEARTNALALRYILDFAEIPTSQRMTQLDSNGDGTVSEREKRAFLTGEAKTLPAGLSLQVDGRAVPLRVVSSGLELPPGAGGLDTLRVTLDMTTPLGAGEHRVAYEDTNFAGRTGWMEVLARAAKGRALRDSDAATSDLSHGLTVFPLDAGIVPPRQTTASFVVTSGSGNVLKSRAATDKTQPAASAQSTANSARTPQNGFTQSIAERNLTPGLMLTGMLLALLFGAVHALSPGHGKTMVAAYLVGTRGTPRHAMLLGLVVTITHTAGVFALGLLTLFATQFIVPERLYPALSAVSGLLIFGVGLWLLMSRLQLLKAGGHHDHENSHDHDHEHSHSHDADGHSHNGHSHDHPHSHDEHTHDHSHAEHEHSHATHAHSHDGNAHDHSHGHNGTHVHAPSEAVHAHAEHAHSHDETPHSHAAHSHGEHTHSHGGKAHSHAVPEGPITARTLVMLGISGGIVPCPEALVVLLAAVKLHRIAYGLLLICAFSVGLAAALIAIGLTVVAAQRHLSRFSQFGSDSLLARYLPVASALIITVIGALLTLRAASGAP